MINGDTMNNTYVPNVRTRVFAEYFDNRTEGVKSMKILVRIT